MSFLVQSLRLAPGSNAPSQVSSTSFGEGAPSVPALRDTIRGTTGPALMSELLNNRHPLESRLAQWETTQQELKMQIMRRTLGPSEPIIRTMEMEAIKATDQFLPSQVLGYEQHSAHSNVLRNSTEKVDWEDIYPEMGENGTQGPLAAVKMDMHSALAKRMGL